MAKEATKPQTKYADRMILPSSSPKYSRTYLRVCGSKKQIHEKHRFRHLLLSSFSYKTFVKHSLPTKALLELIYIQNNIAFAIVLAMTSSVCKLVRVAVLASYDSVTF